MMISTTPLRKRLTASLVSIGLLFSFGASGQELTKLDKLKAAYLFNFTKYIKWQPQSDSADKGPIYICVQGDSRFQSFLAALALNRPVGNNKRQVIVQDYQQSERCHVSYISAPNIILSPHMRNSLVVVSSKQISHPFAAISYYLEEGKLRFEVDLTRIEELNISLSSELLKLAKIK